MITKPKLQTLGRENKEANEGMGLDETVASKVYEFIRTAKSQSKIYVE